MQMAITCSQCKRRFKPDEIIAKLVFQDDISYYCWNHVKGVAKLLKDGGRLEYMKAGLFQAEIGARLRHQPDMEYTPPTRQMKIVAKVDITQGIDKEIVNIIETKPGLIAIDVVELQKSYKSKSTVYKHIAGLLSNGVIKKVRRGLYVNC